MIEPASRLDDTPSDDHEDALRVRIRNNDGHAFTELVTRYLDTVTRFAYYIAGSHDAAEDIAQHAFISLWERRDTLDNVRSLKAYLFRAVRNRALDEQKAASVRDRYRNVMQAEVQAGTYDGSGTRIEDAMLTVATVQAAIERLSERRRLVLRLRIEEELTHAEIGEVLGLSPQAAQVLAGRALADLRKILGVFD